MSRNSRGKVIGMDIVIEAIDDEVINEKKAIRVMKRILRKIGKRADYLCPKDTKLLVNSRESTVIVGDDRVTGQTAYGSEEAYYALYVHEDTDKFHKPPTQHHYLEKALDDLETEIDNELETL